MKTFRCRSVGAGRVQGRHDTDDRPRLSFSCRLESQAAVLGGRPGKSTLRARNS